MICETCKGAGQVARRIEDPRALIVEPCPSAAAAGYPDAARVSGRGTVYRNKHDLLGHPI
jgi:hypothetical protein